MAVIIGIEDINALSSSYASLSLISDRPRPLLLPAVVSSRPRRAERVSSAAYSHTRCSEDSLRRAAEAHDSANRIESAPDEGLVRLPRIQQESVYEVHRRRKKWKGLPVKAMPSGGVRLDGGPVISEGEASMLESDVSSIISIGDQFVPSDTEEEDGLQDKQKYRMPDIGKTRLHLRTKEPLSPTPRPVPVRQRGASSPSTPRTMERAPHEQSPMHYRMPSASVSNENISDSDLASSGLSRANSIYTLGRASLAGQLSHLTSLRLPDANSLAKKISSIPTSTEAAKALSDAAEQIRIWITKASEVLHNLSAEDDVEWAAAGGREGIEDVDKAIHLFHNLVDVYVLSIERLQTREDISSLSEDELNSSVMQMEAIMTSWQQVKDTLRGVKEQVEIAMEWEQLWNTVLGEIAQEMEGLNRLVFEMEERRHQGAESLLSSKDSIDINDLETIIEERPGQGPSIGGRRLGLSPFSPTSPLETSPSNDYKDDSTLLALFARMQPLRASLDFLPMRLSAFLNRGNAIFPSACQDLEQRKVQLEAQWVKLEADAESLRRELGEDRWILVFRNAGRQALKMEESITRSFNKLRDAVDSRESQINPPSFAKKAESYEAKKVHYGPAIGRVLAIIDRGVEERLTVNGEILRLQSDMKQRWNTLQAEMRDMDLVLEDLNNENRDKQLRDSVSTVVSSERSIASSLVDTPGSSPASSVVGTGSFQGSRTPTPLMNGKTRKTTRIPSSIPRRIPLTQSGEFSSTPSSSPLASRTTNSKLLPVSNIPASNRPRWSHNTRLENRDFLPLSTYEPSPYAKAPVAKHTNYLRAATNPIYTPLAHTIPGRNVSTPNQTPTQHQPATVPKVSISQHSNRKSSLPVPSATPSRPALTKRQSAATLRTPGLAGGANRRTSGLVPPKFTDGNDADTESPAHHKIRPASAMAAGRGSSMLPTRARGPLNDVPSAIEEKPRWRP